MTEENMEALERMRAYGKTLQSGAPHQTPIGNDIIALCGMVGDRANPPMTATGEDLKAAMADLRRAHDEIDELKAHPAHNEADIKALLFIARARFEPDDNPFMVLLRKTARDALDDAGIDWSDQDNAGLSLTLPPMEPFSAAAEATGGRDAKTGTAVTGKDDGIALTKNSKKHK